MRLRRNVKIVLCLMIAAAGAGGFYYLNRPTVSKEPETQEKESENTVAGDISIAGEEIKQSDKLKLSSLYTSTILNPDAGNEFVENVASMEVTNTSDQYLVRAEVSARMSDGSEVLFVLKDLPAGKTAEVFDSANRTLTEDVICQEVTCTSEEYATEGLIPDGIEVSSEGTYVIVTNKTGAEVTNLTVIYRCSMGDQYLGGTSYTTTIETLNNEESYTVTDDSLMGEIEIVRIYR